MRPSKLYMGVKEVSEHPLVVIWVLHIGSALGYSQYLGAIGTQKPSLPSIFGSSVEEASDPFVLGIARVENRATNPVPWQRVPYLPSRQNHPDWQKLCGSLQRAGVGSPVDVRSSNPLRRRWPKPPINLYGFLQP